MSSRRHTFRSSCALAVAITAAACGSEASPGASSPSASYSPTESAAPSAAEPAPEIAQVHAHQCGRCHTPPVPGTRTRAYLTDALSRHHKRVHLPDDAWRAMIDYLAAP